MRVRRAQGTFMLARAIVATAAAAVLGGTAAAHHPVSESGVASVVPATVAELGVAMASFSLGDQSGTWNTLTAGLELGLAGRFSIGARLPIAHIAYDDGRDVTGIGDTELTVKVAALIDDHDRFNLSFGAGVELPTGDEADGLSGGHVELTPFVTAASALPHGDVTWVLVGLVGARLSLAGDDDEAPAAAKPHDGETHGAAHGAIIAPHADRELFARASAAILVDRWFGGVALEGVQVLEDVDFGPLTARVEGGVTLAELWRLGLAVDTTVAGEARYDWRGSALVARRF
jgi:hypothetical protein